jgi:pterin-4a-carbinolamine dehydratase
VVAELYTTRLGGLSYNDFRMAQTIDGALAAYRERAKKTAL